MSTKLQVDLYIASPARATTGFTEYEKSVWSPISCVLVHGPESAALIDTPITIEQGEALAKWIKETIPTKKLKYIYTTHAHPDHFMSVPVLQKLFPGVEFIATQNVTAGIEELYNTTYDHIWPGLFPDQLHPTKPVPRALPASAEFYIDGEKLQGIEVGHTDNQFSSFLHVPSVALVVTGDIVYGDCHQFFGEANTPARRKEWLDAIDRIESLNPHIVVAGHKRATQADAPYLIQSTREYIYTFEKELVKAKSAEELYDRMIALYPQRWNLFILHIGCQQSFAVRENKV
ncbi:Metallo-hydrolase/oxidoreductase [Plenodomus tracheiphilus IPT5]|uniref:Metallo-hydrolase/oxidoreductase n=1 Tax=Plenodomus tracheiphilus IPT5 TaxID=1408161 RepID=A0A6A7AZ40_9PLEO|nr:Metallo-hydrolase/oxidoreductase [Plenodomus tracheiphilus IPT5]